MLLILICAIVAFFLRSRFSKHPIKDERIPTNGNGTDVGEKELHDIFQTATEALTTEQLFLKKNIKINDLAIHIGHSEKIVSKAINKHTQLNFNAFINNFRIEYSKELLTSGKFDHYTLEAIADESGFSNKVSFNQAFKTQMRMSPSEFRAQKQPK